MAKQSKIEQARKMWPKIKSKPRAEIMEIFQKKIKLTKAGANTYINLMKQENK